MGKAHPAKKRKRRKTKAFLSELLTPSRANLPPKADGINSASVTCGSYDTKERKLIPPVRQVSIILGYFEYFLCRCVLLHLFCNQGMTVDRETDRKKPC